MPDETKLEIRIYSKGGTGSYLVTVTSSTQSPAHTAKVFVVKKTSNANPQTSNNIDFLGVASAADYHFLGETPSATDPYRTDVITAVFSCQAKLDEFLIQLREDLEETIAAQDSQWKPAETLLLTSNPSVSGPFFFGSVYSENL